MRAILEMAWKCLGPILKVARKRLGNRLELLLGNVLDSSPNIPRHVPDVFLNIPRLLLINILDMSWTFPGLVQEMLFS